mmetsp:Transcript_87914/g.146142  ORF Transcript_87914/g.146142 Transcript_87914/m.146142 type:complete len:333 (-) Transcript_87914:1013-2011(-)
MNTHGVLRIRWHHTCVAVLHKNTFVWTHVGDVKSISVFTISAEIPWSRHAGAIAHEQFDQRVSWQISCRDDICNMGLVGRIKEGLKLKLCQKVILICVHSQVLKGIPSCQDNSLNTPVLPIPIQLHGVDCLAILLSRMPWKYKFKIDVFFDQISLIYNLGKISVIDNLFNSIGEEKTAQAVCAGSTRQRTIESALWVRNKGQPVIQMRIDPAALVSNRHRINHVGELPGISMFQIHNRVGQSTLPLGRGSCSNLSSIRVLNQSDPWAVSRARFHIFLDTIPEIHSKLFQHRRAWMSRRAIPEGFWNGRQDNKITAKVRRTFNLSLKEEDRRS